MKVLKILCICLVVALFVWGIEVLYLAQRNASAPSRIRSDHDRKRRSIALEFKRKERELQQNYDTRKYLATGKTVYERIFNTQNQSVIRLIHRIAREALPDDWSCEVKVEEFTDFILLIYLPHNATQAEPMKVASYFAPILKYCNSYLSDVAVFDRTHTSYLFFDRQILQDIRKCGTVTSTFAERARQQGESFTRFNSVTIQCETHESHLFLPIEVTGPSGVLTCYALFDTGASTTTLADEIVANTGFADLSHAPRRTFNTANGWMSCPIVRREVSVGGYRREIEVAVNQRDKVNLLGVNFFHGIDYIVDFQKSCIYVWER
jgi:predicted aspartyl protease